MTQGKSDPLTFENLHSDPLIQMVMDSDGVSAEQHHAVLEAARQAVRARRRRRQGSGSASSPDDDAANVTAQAALV